MNKWIRRKRNSHGYGVQSPTDFYFVQHVLREEMPYYGYHELQQAEGRFPISQPQYAMPINRMLFRLANYVHPQQMIEVGTGSGLAAYAMAMAVPSGRCTTIDSPHQQAGEVASALAHLEQVTVLNGDEMALYSQLLQQVDAVELLHVAYTSHYREVVEMALPRVTDRSLFIIEGIDADADKRIWWRALQESQLTGVSYDVGSVGLLFFDKARYKDMYWVSLRKHS